MKDGNVYWSKAALDQDVATAHLLAVGDSWFWYPMPGGSLIQHIGRLVASKQYNILVAGNNGAEAYDYVKGKYKRQVRDLLRLYGSSALGLFISGGGNDFAGFSDLRPMLRADCHDATEPLECFVPGSGEGTFEWLMERTFENYAILISRALNVLPAIAPIFVHTYDYAIPDGRGVMGGRPWLQPALIDAQVSPALHAGCVKFLMDGFYSVLNSLASQSSGRVVLVDTRGTMRASDWANELHPKRSGFKRLAVSGWQPILAANQLA